MVFDYHVAFFKKVHSYLSLSIVPIEYIVNTPMQVTDSVINEFTSKHSLKEENAYLKSERLMLKMQLQKLIDLQQENQQLRALLQSSSQAKGKIIGGEIIGITPDPFKHELLVNRGTMAQVYEGQPVLDATGVMGQVIQTGVMMSRILLITDSRSAIPVQVTRNGLRGILVGTGSSYELRLINMEKTVDIKVGDALVTSGLEQVYPTGYPVGQVTEIAFEPGEHFAVIKVKPSAQLEHTREVLLVWPVFNEIEPAIKDGLMGKKKP